MFHLRQRWNFPSNNYGQILGIADSGVETFKGAPIKSLAREICQNSLDARLDNGQPTRVEFKVFELSPHALPDYEGLEDACKRALAFWSKQHARKAQDFFRQALDTLHGISVTCLRISDFNTTGLLGSRAEYNSPWCNLTLGSLLPMPVPDLERSFTAPTIMRACPPPRALRDLPHLRTRNMRSHRGSGSMETIRTAPCQNHIA